MEPDIPGHLLNIAAKGYPCLFCVLCYIWMFFFLHNVNKNVVCYFVIRLLIWLRKSLASSQRVLNWFRGHLAKCLNGKYFTSHSSRPCSRPCQNVGLTLILFAPWIPRRQEAVTDAGEGGRRERDNQEWKESVSGQDGRNLFSRVIGRKLRESATFTPPPLWGNFRKTPQQFPLGEAQEAGSAGRFWIAPCFHNN